MLKGTKNNSSINKLVGKNYTEASANILVPDCLVVGLFTQGASYPHLAMCSDVLLYILFYIKHNLFYIICFTQLQPLIPTTSKYKESTQQKRSKQTFASCPLPAVDLAVSSTDMSQMMTYGHYLLQVLLLQHSVLWHRRFQPFRVVSSPCPEAALLMVNLLGHGLFKDTLP